MRLQVFRGTVVGAQTQGSIIACEDDGGGAVGVNDRIHSVTNPDQTGSNSERYLFTLVNEGDPFARCHIDIAAAAADDVQGFH